MEDIGSEVSQKIRAAIKAKLIELGAYVDDELPDYIMVMVANKRTRSQMDDDLQLFLSSNTKIFTSWLHTVLQKLQEVTVANFENKKDSDSKKLPKKKKSDTEDGRSRKSSEEGVEKAKKHSKKHKDSKKGKKNKHKAKEKAKGKKSEKESSREKSEKEDEQRTSQEKISKNKNLELNEAVGKVILGDLKKSKKLKSDKNESSSESSSSSDDEDSKLDEKSVKENENGSNKPGDECVGEDVTDKPADSVSIKKNTKEVIEDEFNIEPLKPTEIDNVELLNIELQGSARSKGTESKIEVEKTISSPTEELLKEHNKIQKKKLESKTGGEKKPKSESEESVSPEEIRKQLLLSRAKKKLEESKKAERMRSNSPDLLKGGDAGGRQKDLVKTSSRQPEARSTHSEGRGSSRSGSPRPSKQRSSLFSERRSPESSERSTYRRIVTNLKSKPAEMKSSNGERRKISFGRLPSPEKEKTGERKKMMKLSEKLELEKNLGVKKENEAKTKEESSRKRPVCSRVVTITGPEAPEIPSIVKVKPREFISKDKQANKALILKAVADAEKSIATVHARPEIEPEPKKEALYTKNLREKRYEKLAITLSNLRRNVSAHDSFRLGRRVSIESDKSYKKRDSSDVSDGVRMISKKMSKSDDQFISSKTTIMEKNEKYIRCWLEGVEKAVKEEEMINPSDMDDMGLTHYTDEENAEGKKRKRKSTETSGDTSSKNLKIADKEGGITRVIPSSGKKEDEPKIVVTLDGLDSKAIKNLILKNKEATGRPLLGSSATGKKQEKSSVGVKPGEKISDRFGRLNKTNENEGGRGEKKGSKHPGEEEPTEKKPKTESKNRQLIAQLSEKFGKVDREFESRKRKRPEEERRYEYESRRNEKEDGERNGRYRKSERKCFKDAGFGFYRRS